MRYKIFARHKYIYDGAITLTDLAPETARKTDDVYIVHEEYAPNDQEPIGYIETDDITDNLLGDYTDSAVTVLQASEILASVDQDIAEGLA